MKNRTLLIVSLLLTMVVGVNAQCCNKSVSKPEVKKACCSSEVAEAEDVQVYYFHATRRCATCKAVESETQKTIKNKYASKVKFTSINREKDSKNPLLKKYKVNGQTLLLVKGNKVYNLTNDAFMYARTKPEKFAEKLSSKLNTLL